MNPRLIVCVVLLIFAAGCNSNPDKSKRINLIDNPNIKLRDTSFNAYYNDIFYSPYIVRLDKSARSAFILIDTAYNKVNHLDKTNREEYYKKALQLTSKDDIAAHKAVWAIPELREQQQADGGNGTMVTCIKERLDEKSGYYIIEVKRNDVEQISQVKGTSFFRIRLRPQHIEIADESAYFVSLDVWRRARK